MNASFFNCDWGTSRFRLRLVDAATGSIRSERRSDEGVVSLAAPSPAERESRFREVLDRHVAAIVAESDLPLAEAPVLISGMASSSIGWRELPYAVLPFALNGADLHFVRLDTQESAAGRPTFLFSGVRSDCDVMRGEELELMGLGILFPERWNQPGDQWVVLPGTHSKHVLIRQGVVVAFQTYLTGELFHLLGRHSSLRHAGGDITSAEIRPDGENPRWRDAFLAGVELARQNELNGSLFQVRVRQLLSRDDAVQSAALLSGILIGSELQTFVRPRSESGTIMLAASSDLSESYRLAFDQLGLASRVTLVPPSDVARLSALGQLRALRRIASPVSARE